MSGQSSSNLRFSERRRYERIPVKMGASAFASNTDASFECTILDISEGGAKVKIPDLDILPVGFKLYIPEMDQIHACRIVWRDGNYVGLEFQPDAPV